MENKPVIVEQTINASPEKIWKALTDKDQMKQWYFDLKEFKPEVGFEFEFMGGKDEDNQYLHKCKITEVIPDKKLKHSWRFDGYPGNSFVTWELFPEGAQTKVRLTHSGLETFKAANNPDFDKENFEAGWTQIVQTSLKEFAEK